MGMQISEDRPDQEMYDLFSCSAKWESTKEQLSLKLGSVASSIKDTLKAVHSMRFKSLEWCWMLVFLGTWSTSRKHPRSCLRTLLSLHRAGEDDLFVK